MQPFHTINVSEMCGEVVLSQGVILLDQSAAGESEAERERERAAKARERDRKRERAVLKRCSQKIPFT